MPIGDDPQQPLVIQHTVNTVCTQLPIQHAVLPIHATDTFTATLPFNTCSTHIHFVTGGEQRMLSVLAGIQHCISLGAHANDWVLVHDVARPCVHATCLHALWQQVIRSNTGAVLATPVRDTLKQVEHGHIVANLSREHAWAILTPQIFKLQDLVRAIELAMCRNEVCTDESSAIQSLGLEVNIVAGRADNIKITYPDDLKLAALILQSHKV